MSAILVIVCCAIAAPLLAQAVEAKLPQEFKRIKEAEARQLVMEALERIEKHDLKHTLTLFRSDVNDEFFYFEAHYETAMPNGASPHVGNYVVNRVTGDVFSMDTCKGISSPSLRMHRAKIRKRLGLSDQAYKKLDSRRCVP